MGDFGLYYCVIYVVVLVFFVVWYLSFDFVDGFLSLYLVGGMGIYIFCIFFSLFSFKWFLVKL